MKRSIFLLIASVVFLTNSARSQNQWSEVTNFNNDIWDIEVFDGKLFVVGLFTENEGQPSNYSAYYDNGLMIQDANSYGSGGIMSLEVFNNQLWAGSAIMIGGNFAGVSYWQDTIWADGSGTVTNGFSGLLADNNDLYGGVFGTELMMKTGTGAWTSLAPLDGGSDDIIDIVKFNDTIIVGGSISASNGTTIDNLGFYDGSALQSYGNGTDGTVNALEVYNGELYVGGSFANAGGTSANFIAKWDGSSWSDVGGSVTGTGTEGVHDMLVYNNKLYVVGDFNEIGGVAVNGAAYWDGSNWHDMNFPSIPGFARTIEVMDYYLYAGTNEETGSIDTSHIYRMPLSLANTPSENTDLNLVIYPNPAMDKITVKSHDMIEEIIVQDNTGRELKSLNNLNQFEMELSLLDLDAGVYFIRCKTEGGTTLKKFIKN